MKIILRLYYMYFTSASISKNNEISHQSIDTNVNDNNEISIENFIEEKLKSTSNDTKINEELLMNYLSKLSMNITNENYYYIDTFNNIQNIVELCNIQINNNINELIISYEFIHLFSFLEHDIINVLSRLKFFNFENAGITKIILKLNQSQCYQYKIPLFLKVLQELLNINFKIESYLNPEKCNIFKSILFMFHKKSNLSNNNLDSKIYYRLKLLRKNINIHFESYEMLTYLIKTINKITDRKIKNFFVYGLQNIFKFNFRTKLPYYFNILIFLYTYKKENQNYDVDWYKKILNMLSFEKDTVKNYNIKNRILKGISDTDKFFYFELYIIMNSTETKKSFNYLKMLKNNEKQLKLLYNLIILVNVIKCKIYGLCRM